MKHLLEGKSGQMLVLPDGYNHWWDTVGGETSPGGHH